MVFNPSPNNEISNLSRLKAFADYRMNVVQMMNYVFDRAENIVGKGENAGYAFSPFPIMFSKGLFLRGVKSRDCVVKS